MKQFFLFICVIGSLILVAGLWYTELEIRELKQQHHHLMESLAPLRVSLHDAQALLTTKSSDVKQFKNSFMGTAKTQKDLFESGLSTQEERRLLEKQLEIMTTRLVVNPALQRVFVMREEQPLESMLIRYIPLRAFAGAPVTLPGTVRILSKERFAHPERGKSEIIDGKLQWSPPQVGTSVRSRALGEFVIFTNSKLIFHGPPVSDEDHERFPHVCMGLDKESARRIYRSSFIGTRVQLSNVNIEAVPLPLPQAGATRTSSMTVKTPS